MSGAKSALVIGAGPCGLVAFKELEEHGVPTQCIERTGEVGGIFAPGNTYPSCHLTVSNFWICYSDYPCQDAWPPRYWTRGEYCDYMIDYAKHFGLHPKIQFFTNCEELVKVGPKRWKATMLNMKTKKTRSEEFDAVSIASGAYLKPKDTRFKGHDDYVAGGGVVCHSQQFQTAEPFAGKTVVIVGCGESGADMAHDVAEIAKSATMVVRKPMVIGPRHPGKILTGEAAKMTDRSKSFEWDVLTAPWGTIDGIVTRQQAMVSRWCHNKFRYMGWGMTAGKNLLPSSVLSEWNLEATKHLGEDYHVITKNDAFIPSLASGKLKANTSGVCHLEGNGGDPKVCFKDGQSVCAGTILLCTGYDVTFPYLKTEIDLRPRHWYKHFIPQELKNENICILGFARPQQGGIPQTAEMGARLFAMMVTGKKEVNFTEDEVEKEATFEDGWFKATVLQALCDYPRYMEQMSKLIGCEPQAPSVFSPQRFYAHYAAPMYCTQWRSHGPGAKPDIVAKFYDKIGKDNGGPTTPIFALLAMLCQAFWFMPGTCPKLWIDHFGVQRPPAYAYLFPLAYLVAGVGAIAHHTGLQLEL